MFQLITAKMSFSYLAVVASVSFTAFRVFYHVVKSNFSPPPAIPSTKEWLYWNTLISFIHACISAVWSIYCFLDNPAMLINLMKEWSLPSTYLLAFLIGYTVHDALDIIAHDFKGSPGLLIHHVVVTTISVFVLYTEQYLPLATSLCVIEFNSIFLHFRRLMRFHGGNHSQFAYKINLVALFVTFIALRFVFLGWLTGYFVYIRQMVHLSHFLLGAFGFIALIVINMILFIRLLKTEFLTKKLRSKDHRNGFVQEKFN